MREGRCSLVGTLLLMSNFFAGCALLIHWASWAYIDVAFIVTYILLATLAGVWCVRRALKHAGGVCRCTTIDQQAAQVADRLSGEELR